MGPPSDLLDAGEDDPPNPPKVLLEPPNPELLFKLLEEPNAGAADAGDPNIPLPDGAELAPKAGVALVVLPKVDPPKAGVAG